MLQAIPTYSMSVFLLPKSLCRKLHYLFAKFWWGHQENHMGDWVRDLHSFNLVVLAKQVWRFLMYPNSLPSRILRQNIFQTIRTFLQAELGVRPSYMWRSIFQSIPLLGYSQSPSFVYWQVVQAFEDFRNAIQQQPVTRLIT